MEFRGFKTYAIFDEGTNEFFSVELEDWTDEVDGGCLFPTYDMAFEYIKECGFLRAKVCNIEIPQKEKTYEYSPVHLPCDVED